MPGLIVGGVEAVLAASVGALIFTGSLFGFRKGLAHELAMVQHGTPDLQSA